MTPTPTYRDTQTPCVGICSTVYGDDICRGCKRSCQEVISWNGYTEAQKTAVLIRLDQQVSSVCQQFFNIIDVQLLKQRINTNQMQHNADASPYLLAFLFLNAHADDIHAPADCGIQLKPSVQGDALRDVINHVDAAIYQHALSALA